MEVAAWLLFEYLPLPDASRDARPFALEYPLRVRHELVLDNVKSYRKWTEHHTVDSPGFFFEYKLSSSLGAITLSHELYTKADHVMPDAMNKYVENARHESDQRTSGGDSGYLTKMSAFGINAARCPSRAPEHKPGAACR